MNTRVIVLLTILIPLQAVENSTLQPTTPPPTTTFNGHYMRFARFIRIIRHNAAVTPFTLGLVVNGFSQNNVRAKLFANGAGLACSLAAHMFFNSSYCANISNDLSNQKSSEDTPQGNDQKWCPFMNLVAANLKTSCLAYGAGASTGALMRFGCETIVQWLATKTAERNRLAVDELLGKNYSVPLTAMYCGDKESFRALHNIDSRYIDSGPFIAKTAWEGSIKPYLQAQNITFEAKNVRDYPTRIALARSAFEAWIKSIIVHLEKVTQLVSKDELANASDVAVKKIYHNKKYVDEAFRQILEAIL